MLSVIIPTLNEEQTIGRLLTQLQQQKHIKLQVIVADGGSSDRTLAIAADNGVTIVESSPGRGKQMNQGTESATYDYLLFLHADTQLTSEDQLHHSLERLRDETGPVAGHYPVVFDSSDPRLRFFEGKTSLNRPGTWNGDQGLMIEAKLFRMMDAYSERYTFLEDQDFGNRFNELGRFITFDDSLVTSARRFEVEGVAERIRLNTLIMLMFHLSLDDFFDRAAGIYRTNDQADRLVLKPYFAAARASIWSDGFLVGAGRYLRLGRYAIKNLWQVFFWLGIRRGRADTMLDRHDRFARPLADNPLGYLAAVFVFAAWFHGAEFLLSIRRGK